MTLSSSPELFAPCPDLKLSRKEAYMQPFRFLDLPAVEFRSGLAKVSMLTPLLELRNYTYNLVGCGSTGQTRKRQKVVVLRELQRAIIYTTR